MLEVNLKQFFKTGSFGPVRLGMSKETIERLLGKPDDYGTGSKPYLKAHVWRYDAIEFHFQQDGTLWLIWCDYIPFLEHYTSTVIQLESWLFRQAHPPTQAEMAKALETAGISFNYHRKTGQIHHHERKLVNHSDIDQQTVTFCSDDSTGQFRLESGVYIEVGDRTFYLKSQEKPVVCPDLVLAFGMSLVTQTARA